MTAAFILNELLSVANPEKAKFLQGFFKTGKGQYAEGDIFLGLIVPLTRSIAKTNKQTPLPELQILLDSEYHEARLCALLIMMEQMKKTSPEQQVVLYDFYLANARSGRINNWDLVDVTCRDVVGTYLLDKDKAPLYELAATGNLWEQRIAIVSTWMFIKHRQFDDTFALSERLIDHQHDLMHKAIGWMLREVGKKDREALSDFLDTHATRLPRTALRYAIEHYPEEERQFYLKKK